MKLGKLKIDITRNDLGLKYFSKATNKFYSKALAFREP
jgi:hypothetical protein